MPKSIEGKKFIVTAGPTYEPIDPIRFLGNHSSGKMGFAIAEELAENKDWGIRGQKKLWEIPIFNKFEWRNFVKIMLKSILLT